MSDPSAISKEKLVKFVCFIAIKDNVGLLEVLSRQSNFSTSTYYIYNISSYYYVILVDKSRLYIVKIITQIYYICGQKIIFKYVWIKC